MKQFSGGDKIFLLLITLVTFLFSGLLWSDYRNRGAEGEGEIIGTITFKQRVAQRKFQGTVIWDTLEQNAPLRNNDSIRTSDLSEAEITLLDGTKIDLDENSMVLLNLGRDGAELDFAYGKISAGISGENKQLKIRAGEKILEAKDSQLSLSGSFSPENPKPTQGDKQGLLRLFVERGEAKLEGNGETLQVAANQNLTETDEGYKTTTSPISNLKPGEIHRIGSGSATTQLEFSWDGDPRGTIKISRYRNLSNPIQTQNSSTGKLSVSLAPGTWYWNLRTKDYTSSTRRILIYRWESPLPYTPARSSNLTTTQEEEPVYFSWKKSEQGTTYVLQVYPSGTKPSDIQSNTTQPLWEETTRYTSYRKPMKPGTYQWRIGFKDPLQGNIHWSGIQDFSLTRISNLKAPDLIQPPNGTNIFASITSTQGLLLSWKSTEKNVEYQWEIQDNKGTTIDSGMSSKSSFVWKKEIPEGEYRWRIRTLLSGLESSWSSYRSFHIQDKSELETNSPRPNSIVYTSEENPVSFGWKKISNIGRYKVTITKPDGKSESRETNQNTLSWKGLDSGNHTWRVEFLDNKNNPLAESRAVQFQVQKGLEPPVPLSPIQRKRVDLTYANQVQFEWKPSPFVKFYRLEIYPKGKRDSPLYKEQTLSNIFYLNRLNRLSTGYFEWKVVALSKEGFESSSDLAEFEIFLNPDKGRLEFTSPETFYVDP